MERFQSTERIVNLQLRLPESLHKELERLKNKHRCSLQKEIIDGLIEYVAMVHEREYYDSNTGTV